MYSKTITIQLSTGNAREIGDSSTRLIPVRPPTQAKQLDMKIHHHHEERKDMRKALKQLNN